MNPKSFDAYFLDGDEGKAIKLWTFEVENALDALDQAKDNLRKVGITPRGNTCLQVIPHDSEPMDVLAWKNRRCLPVPSDPDGLAAVRAAAYRDLGNSAVQRVIRQAGAEETRKLDEIARDQEFGLSEICPQMKVWQNWRVRAKIMPDTKPKRTFEELIDALCEDETT